MKKCILVSLFLLILGGASTQQQQGGEQPTEHEVESGLDIQLEDVMNEISKFNTRFSKIEEKLESLESEISQLGHLSLGSFLNPSPSCKLIQEGSPSGHYWIQHTGTGYANLEYCDMTRRCCNSTGGWMRVAHLNMTDENQRCPSGFRLITSNSAYKKRTCGTPGSSCVSVILPLNGVVYSRVCGKIIAYQFGSPNGFGPYRNTNPRPAVDGSYLDGVSLTHGQKPRKHIWTFAGKVSYSSSHCPCSRDNSENAHATPPFVGEDYFCDSGNSQNWQQQYYYANPLWDGEDCHEINKCCTFNNPPWFCKELPQPTSDDIEMRVCLNGPNTDEDIVFESVDIYVQ